MKKTAIIAMAAALCLGGALAPAAESAGASGAVMQEGQKAAGQGGMEAGSMKQGGMKKAHSRRRTPEQIKAIQEALNAYGAKLEPDGKWGKETRRAIRDFQKAHGMKATGYANQKTREALGLDF